MLAKVKVESAEYPFIRGLLLQCVCAFIISKGYLRSFFSLHPEGCFGEDVIYVLGSEYVMLVLLPLLFLCFTSDRHNQPCRYPLLIRYKSKNDFFYCKVLSKIIFAFLFLTISLGIILLIGVINNVPYISKQNFLLTEEFEYIIFMMFLNAFCYILFLLMLHEILKSILQNNLLNILMTAALPITNLVLVKLQLTQIVLWSPWGNIAYILEGQERGGYGFYWWYWLFLLLVTIYMADVLNRRKDYVFEKDKKTN